jgi:hypothetical protein
MLAHEIGAPFANGEPGRLSAIANVTIRLVAKNKSPASRPGSGLYAELFGNLGLCAYARGHDVHLVAPLGAWSPSSIFDDPQSIGTRRPPRREQMACRFRPVDRNASAVLHIGEYAPRARGDKNFPAGPLYLRPFIFAASAIHGIQRIEGRCHSQSKEWTIAPTTPRSLGVEPTSWVVEDRDQIGLAVALARTARSNSNHESR